MLLDAGTNSHRQHAVDALLRAIDDRDLSAMETSLEALRRALRPPASAGSFEAERVDALAGLAEDIERSLRRMRATAAGEMARIRAAAPLLAHVGSSAAAAVLAPQ